MPCYSSSRSAAEPISTTLKGLEPGSKRNSDSCKNNAPRWKCRNNPQHSPTVSQDKGASFGLCALRQLHPAAGLASRACPSSARSLANLLAKSATVLLHTPICIHGIWYVRREHYTVYTQLACCRMGNASSSCASLLYELIT
eukprot:1310973-Amphidinium_carterae.1